MKFKKSFVKFLALVFCLNLFITTTVFAKPNVLNTTSDGGGAGGGWYAPNGGVWKQTGYMGSPVTRPTKKVYISYEQLAIMCADKLVKNDLSTIKNVVRDKGTAAALSWLSNKLGQKAAAKYIPYLGDVWVAYDVFDACVSYCEDQRYKAALTNHCGIVISTGYTVSGGYTLPYSAIDYWYGPSVSNPYGFTGTFSYN